MSAPARARRTPRFSIPASTPSPGPSKLASSRGARAPRRVRRRVRDRRRAHRRAARRLDRRTARTTPGPRRAGRGQRLRPRAGSSTRSELYELEPHLGPGALGALAVPDESIIDPWSPAIAFATEAVRNGTTLWRDAPGARRRRGRLAVGAVDTAGPCRWPASSSTRAACSPTPSTGCSDTPTSPSRPAAGSSSCSTSSRASSSGTSCCRCRPPPPRACSSARRCSATWCSGRPPKTSTTRRTRRRRAPGSTRSSNRVGAFSRRSCEEETTAVYAGLRAATEHSDYQIHAHEGYITVGGIRSTGTHRVARHRRARAHPARRGRARPPDQGAASKACACRTSASRRPARSPTTRASTPTPTTGASCATANACHARRDPGRLHEHRRALRPRRPPPSHPCGHGPLPRLQLPRANSRSRWTPARF